jgi:hypothetical protein
MLLLFLAADVFAAANSELSYSLPEVFSAAVRFVRVDRGCKLIDQDPGVAFVTFEYVEDGHHRRGAVEMWKTAGGTGISVKLGDEPHYMELRWLELIQRKLKDERGTPVPPPPPAQPPAPSPEP